MTDKFMQMLQNLSPRSNRTLDDLRTSTDQLSGMDAMELRGFASQNPMVPSRDLTDPLGKAVLSTLQNQSDALREYAKGRGEVDGAVKEMYEKRWGPTAIPIYNVILALLHQHPDNKEHILSTTRYLAEELKVPVDGTDVTGASALYWSISTKPFAEPAFAQTLFDAGGSVNQKNRFNGTCASEIAQVDFSKDTSANVQMLKWYVEHGGDVHGKDNDGMNVKMLAEMMAKRVPGLVEAVKNGRGERREGECENCGRTRRTKKAFAACARCKQLRYCSVECQKVDWRGHKAKCKAGE